VIYEPKQEAMPRERLRKLQLDRLRSLVDYVKERVPLYRERLAGSEPEEIGSLEDLRLLPLLGAEPWTERMRREIDASLGRIGG